MKIIQTIQCILSDYDGIELEIKSRKISRKSPTICKLKNKILKESKENQKVFELNENKKTNTKILDYS